MIYKRYDFLPSVYAGCVGNGLGEAFIYSPKKSVPIFTLTWVVHSLMVKIDKIQSEAFVKIVKIPPSAGATVQDPAKRSCKKMETEV